MTVVVYPVDAIASVPTYTGEMTRQAMSAFMGCAPTGRPLGAMSGVRRGTPSTTVSIAGTTWTCAVHAGVMDTETSATAGPYMYAVKVAETGSVTAADATNPRLDLIYALLSDPAESDGSSVPKVEIKYLAGTPASSPSAPATPARGMPLANIRVEHSGGGASTTTWVAPVFGPALWQGNATGGNTVSVPNDAYTTITVDSLSVNTLGLSVGGGSWRANVDGNYLVSGSVMFAANATGSRGGRFALNAVGVNGSNVLIQATATGNCRVALPSLLIPCLAADVISMQAYQNSGGALLTTTGPGSAFTIVQV